MLRAVRIGLFIGTLIGCSAFAAADTRDQTPPFAALAQ